MPWRTQTIMDERARFVFEAEHTDFSFAELCRRYHISSPTGYKWLRRHREEGLGGLSDRSHRPRSCPHALTMACSSQACKPGTPTRSVLPATAGIAC